MTSCTHIRLAKLSRRWHFLLPLFMNLFRDHRWLALSGVVAWLLPSTLTANNTNRFGFRGPEIFPVDNQIGQLRIADLDGDGLNDLVVVNNARSKITLLYNQTGKTNLVQKPRTTSRREFNDL